MAEATVMLMVALTFDLKAKERALGGATFGRRARGPRSLHDRTIGLIGFGRIGRAVVERLQGWGVRAAGYDPYVKPTASHRP